MNKVEELLASLERRGLKVTLHPQGGVAITPTDQLTDDDRAQLRQAAAGLERLLHQRSALTHDRSFASHGQHRAADPQLSAADSRAIAQTLKTFPTSALLEIRPASRIEPEPATLFASATAVAPPPVPPDPKEKPAVEAPTTGTTALNATPVVEASPAPAAPPPGTEAIDIASALPLTSAMMSSTPPAPHETAPEVMVNEPASGDQSSVDEVSSATTAANVDASFTPVTSGPNQKLLAQPRGIQLPARPAPTVSVQSDSEAARLSWQ